MEVRTYIRGGCSRIVMPYKIVQCSSSTSQILECRVWQVWFMWTKSVKYFVQFYMKHMALLDALSSVADIIL